MLALGNTTGEVLKAAVLRSVAIPMYDELRRHFALEIDVATTDSASSNFRAEESFRRDQPCVPRLSVGCMLHLASILQGRSFDVSQSDTSGLVHLALAMQAAGSVEALRHHLTVAVQSDLRVYETARLLPDDHEAVMHRRRVFRLLLGGDERRIAILDEVLNGDIRLPFVERYGPLPAECSMEAFAEGPVVGISVAFGSATCHDPSMNMRKQSPSTCGAMMKDLLIQYYERMLRGLLGRPCPAGPTRPRVTC